MGVGSKNSKSAGFAAVETVLVLVIVAAIVGVGFYVYHQKHSAEKTLSSNTNSAQATAPAGTTASVDQLTQNSAKEEAGVDNSADNSYQQDATSANSAVKSVGGAYNEANY